MISVRLLSRVISPALIIFILSAASALGNSPYEVQTVQIGNAVEYRFIKIIESEELSHHFMTLIDDQGTLNLRPHPGYDINGWGSSLYLQPFLPGAVLKHTVVNSITATDTSIIIDAAGQVSQGQNSNFGDWQVTLQISYDFFEQEINAAGEYSIALNRPLDNSTGDLNLFKLASNYLQNVPLLGQINPGDTGDIERADISGGADFTPFSWIPPVQPAHFPYPPADTMHINLLGQYNNVDSEAQGYARIEPAYKPNFSISLSSHEAGAPMIFGGIFNTSEAQMFWADNVGITPLILKTSPDTDFSFDLNMISTALPGDSIYTTAVGNSETFSPGKFTLLNCYPNPCSSTGVGTAVSFMLNRSYFVELTLYNAMGQSVAVLLKEHREAGSHSLRYNPQNLPSGMYYIRLTAGGLSQTKKIIFIH